MYPQTQTEWQAREEEAEREADRAHKLRELRAFVDHPEETHTRDAEDFACDGCGWIVTKCQCAWLNQPSNLPPRRHPAHQRMQGELFPKEAA